MEHRHFSRTPSKKRRRGLKIILFLFVMTAGIIGVYMTSVYSHVSEATNEMYASLEDVVNLREGRVSLGNKEAISILLLGVDSGDLGRTEQGASFNERKQYIWIINNGLISFWVNDDRRDAFLS